MANLQARIGGGSASILGSSASAADDSEFFGADGMSQEAASESRRRRCGKQPASSVGDAEHMLTPAKRSGSCLGALGRGAPSSVKQQRRGSDA
eukprot:4036687-Pyramimonas_sp.AAC.1